jgi:hypothetical protein
MSYHIPSSCCCCFSFATQYAITFELIQHFDLFLCNSLMFRHKVFC